MNTNKRHIIAGSNEYFQWLRDTNEAHYDELALALSVRREHLEADVAQQVEHESWSIDYARSFLRDVFSVEQEFLCDATRELEDAWKRAQQMYA